MNEFCISESLLNDPLSLEQPASWVGHIPFAFWLIEKHRPEVIVELGTHSGNSYFAFCQAVVKNGLDTKCYAVDCWEGDEHAGHYAGQGVFDKVDRHNREHYSKFSTLKPMSFEEAINDFEDGTIDLLHIDGLHTYKAVKNDFETWLPKMSARGIIIFHDTVVRKSGFGVWKLWEELEKSKRPSFMFEHSNGLGVLAAGEEFNPVVEAFFSTQQHINKVVFESLGLRLADKLVNYEETLDKYEQFAQRRDEQISILESHLQAVQKNSDEQIAYRDLLARDLEGQIIDLNKRAEKQLVDVQKNSNEQIAYRDLLARDLEDQIIDLNKSAEEQIRYRDGEIIRYSNLLIEAEQNIRLLIRNLLQAIKKKVFK